MSTNFQASFSNAKWTCELLTGHLHNLPQLGNLLKRVWTTPQWKHFQKQIPLRGQKPQRPHLRHMWPISVGLLEVRPQTTCVTKICSLEWGAAQAAFLGFAQGKLHMEEFEWNAVLLNLALTSCSSHCSSRKCMLVEDKFRPSSLPWKLILKASPPTDQDQIASRYWRNSSQQMQMLYCLQDHPRFVSSPELQNTKKKKKLRG